MVLWSAAVTCKKYTKTCDYAQTLKVFFVLLGTTATFQEWYIKVEEKEHLQHILAQMDGSGQVLNLRDAPVSPQWMQHCQLLWGGGNHAHRLHSKKTLHVEALKGAFFSDFHPQVTRLGLSRLSASLTPA